MKRALVFLLTVLLLAGNSPSRLTAATATPEETIRGFYAWYVPALVANVDVFGERRGELRRYVSARFLKEIDRALKIPGGVEADPFLCAQDFDADWGKQIAVRNVQIQEDKATAEATLTSKVFGVQRLRVTLVREDGAWKFDRVAGRD